MLKSQNEQDNEICLPQRYKRRSLFQEIRKTRNTRKTRCQKIRNSGISIKSGFIYQLRKISTFQELDRELMLGQI
ncbi:hypothetical protein BpHYR1_042541 [Brachionus plicatilis]|uniref:Uncharacterized protein n=1 Tax=Brachionus plicatilis TaxID=10195 RepID=A0A3M7SZZ1_BRAPC|nr:hypothetical protein BpHYR1_042541 [Brachionus plicatilis]